MSKRYEKGLKIIEKYCGKGKDKIISLATIGSDSSDNKVVQPFVREVDAYYEDGVFYIVTWEKSKKVKQISENNQVAFSVRFAGVSGNGIGENLGWVLDPKNAEIRLKLRKSFEKWYDDANNEQDESCIILAIKITRCKIFRDHGATQYNLDFVNKVEIE